MAQTSTLLQVLDLSFQRGLLGQKIPNADIGSIAAGAIVSVAHLRRGRYGADEYRNRQTTIHRPGNATGIADDYRDAGTLTPSTGSLAPDANWADTTLGTEDVYFFERGIHPLWYIDAANLALRQNYFQNEDWLSLAADPGFQSTATSSYVESDADAGPATTFSKITTADSYNVFPPFIDSGRILNAAANGYIRQRFKVTRGGEVAVWWFARADVGASGAGMSLVLYDLTNSALLGTAISSSEESWQALHRRESVVSGSAGTEDLEVRLQGIGASDDLYPNGLIVYRTEDNRIVLGTTWENRHLAPTLSYVTFGRSTAADVEAAFSMQRHLIPADAYRFISTRPGANPYVIEWVRDHPFYGRRWDHPILINGRRAHSDVDGPFTRLMTETTSADRDLIEATTRVNLFSDERVQIPNKAALLAQAEDDAKQYSQQFRYEEAARPGWTMSRMPN